ncbi:hypothetical protein O6H91_07G094900 [Diphasiastrum complanatum]|uniref:Uncharacterized protein n=1 Tax=Diphasiastrum complanatum TaxID=34168 RepID=A0ACC2D7P0_DIPCM|nr:hypothetical protein O6H91_07G094900 [Diphasiastrum complanatum]
MDHMEGLLCAEELIGSPLIRENAEFDYSSSSGDHHEDGDRSFFTDFPVQDENAIMCLFEKEVCHMPDTGYIASLQAEDASGVRLQAVDWMFQVRKRYDFGPLTIALAVNYLDRYLANYFLEKRPWKAWMLQLLSVACLSLAAKMEEVHVPTLQDFQIEGLEHIFDDITIQRMELAVLSSLGWRMSSVTAFAYVDFLLHRVNIGKHQQRSIMNRVTELLLETLSETAFTNYRPSIIAISATSCAIEELLPLQAEMHKRTLLQQFPIEKDTLERCYGLMEELVVDPLCASVSSSGVSRETSPSSPVTVVELCQMEEKIENIGRCCCKSLWLRTQSTSSSDMLFGFQILTRKRKIEEVLY